MPPICQLALPKFKIESQLDGKKVLEKLGVKTVFTDAADLTKVSSGLAFLPIGLIHA